MLTLDAKAATCSRIWDERRVPDGSRTHLDAVFGVVPAAVDIEAGVHAAGQVSSLGNGTGWRQFDQWSVVHAAAVQSPLRGRLNGMGPELEHSGGD